jgi:hypothetical protein
MTQLYTLKDDCFFSEVWTGENWGEIQEVFPENVRFGINPDDSFDNYDVVFRKEDLFFRPTNQEFAKRWNMVSPGERIGVYPMPNGISYTAYVVVDDIVKVAGE